MSRSKRVSIDGALAPLSPPPDARGGSRRRSASPTRHRVESARAEARRAVAPWCCAFDPRGSTRGSVAGEKCVAETEQRKRAGSVRSTRALRLRRPRSSSLESFVRLRTTRRRRRRRASRGCKNARARAASNRRPSRAVASSGGARAGGIPSRAAEVRAGVAPSRAAAQCPDARRRSTDVFEKHRRLAAAAELANPRRPGPTVAFSSRKKKSRRREPRRDPKSCGC